MNFLLALLLGINKISLETIGDIAWPEHVSIFTAPIKIAVNFKIPLIIYGENPQLEYGGPKESLDNSTLDKRWMEEFGGLIGLRVNDLVENYGFKNSDLSMFTYPNHKALDKQLKKFIRDIMKMGPLKIKK